MIDKPRIWFVSLSRREQWMVGTAGFLAAVLLTIYGLVLPGWYAIDNARKDHAEAVERRGRIEARIAATTGKRPVERATNTVPLELFVTQSAAEKGFDILKAPAGVSGQMAFRLEQARTPALLAWFDELGQQGVVVRSLTLSPAANGSVTVTATVSKGAQ